jgi:hypothetical protein
MYRDILTRARISFELSVGVSLASTLVGRGGRWAFPLSLYVIFTRIMNDKSPTPTPMRCTSTLSTRTAGSRSVPCIKARRRREGCQRDCMQRVVQGQLSVQKGADCAQLGASVQSQASGIGINTMDMFVLAFVLPRHETSPRCRQVPRQTEAKGCGCVGPACLVTQHPLD